MPILLFNAQRFFHLFSFAHFTVLYSSLIAFFVAFLSPFCNNGCIFIVIMVSIVSALPFGTIASAITFHFVEMLSGY